MHTNRGKRFENTVASHQMVTVDEDLEARSAPHHSCELVLIGGFLLPGYSSNARFATGPGIGFEDLLEGRMSYDLVPAHAATDGL